jgi:hypothetical protein
MLLHDTDAEKPFEASFDARYPYEDHARASSLIKQGWAISLNAAFCVLEELCRPPAGADVKEQRLEELVSEWSSGPDHPLKSLVLPAAHALIANRPLPWSEGVRLMKDVGAYDGQRAALNIAYFASYSDSPEGDDALDRTHEEVCRAWDAKGV